MRQFARKRRKCDIIPKAWARREESERENAVLALLPLLVAGNRPGHEIEYPMAWVIMGGLVASTAMNLFLMPALYRAFGHAPASAAV